MGLMYGGIGLTQRTWKGFAPFLGIALPLAVLERLFDLPWVNVVVAVYVIAVWGTIFLIGGWQAVAGAFAAFIVFSLIGALAPFLFDFPWKPGYLPQPQVLLDGLLTGLGIALGGAYARRRHA